MSSAPANTYDIYAQLVKAGTPVGSSRSSIGNTDDTGGPFVSHDLGGPSDLWGSTWTVSEINSDLAVDVWFDLGVGTAASPFEFDAVGVTVYYTTPSGVSGRQTCIAIGVSPFFKGF
jgi:hypothetical protein